MADIISVDDLPSAIQANESVELLVAGANAMASRVAPCLASTDPAPTDDQLAEARLVLVGAVRRWAESGSGSLSAQVAGPFGQTIDTRQKTGFNLWPSEIESLQEICRAEGTGGTGRAFEVDTMPANAGVYGVDYWWTGPDTTSTVF